MYNENGTSSLEEKDSKRLEAEADTAEVVANLEIEGIHPTSDEIEDLTLIGLGLMTEQEFVDKHINPILARYNHHVMF